MAKINIPEISTGEVVNRIAAFYERALEMGTACKDVRPIMLFGPTGVGKSSSINQIADKLEAALDKKVSVVDIRLTSCTITDLIGIPVASSDKTTTIWLRPDIYKTGKDEEIFIYFFDELDKASPAVQAAALQLILDRKAWTHTFPANTFVIAAANPSRTSSNYETRMAPELMNRFKHFNIQPDYDSFKEWGIKEKLHPYVLGYLSYNHSKLYAESEMDSIAFPTPRSWKSVSDTLYIYDGTYKDISELHSDICADIGVGDALEFEGWCQVYGFLPDTGRIFDGTENSYPNTPDVLHALIASIISYISKKEEKITSKELTNVLRYVSRFPADFKALFYMNLKEIKPIQTKLLKIPEYLEWAKEQHN